jgi:hypothetical protein
MPDNGGPAFPTSRPPNIVGGRYDGMTVRDYFAAAALQGICAQGVQIPPVAATQAYRLADAMIDEREK